MLKVDVDTKTLLVTGLSGEIPSDLAKLSLAGNHWANLVFVACSGFGFIPLNQQTAGKIAKAVSIIFELSDKKHLAFLVSINRSSLRVASWVAPDTYGIKEPAKLAGSRKFDVIDQFRTLNWTMAAAIRLGLLDARKEHETLIFTKPWEPKAMYH